ncbi:Hsp33 family molecular chaperone HslO [Azovibrio restrictus]|uniref:Hsp33 family molecular chaperone HslO n=1 Tax=Azovibrio restrictus TaxID=146938 RepID=UPI0004010D19|nr:Hsp33 family molecular chaperone HslO [Azovibrio restrictus]MDD3482956.1 Hsp33 family molecular chaperone HslO [Azovibrio restrictus]
MSPDTVTRFLFEGLDIRGALVHLGPSWQSLQRGRGYGPVEARLLGEMAAVTVLIAAQLKQPGRLTFQLRGGGPISLLVMDCDEQLRLRGMARAVANLAPAPVPQLLGADQGGQLMLNLDFPVARQPYQSFVPLEGDSIASIFEHYLEQSEQQAARLFLAASDQAACCLFLQKLPGADALDPDGWDRISHLAATVKEAELLELDAATLLGRLFHEEILQGEQSGKGVRLYDPRPVTHHCPEDREKVEGMLLSLGREEAEAVLAEHGEILVKDDICNREYRFSKEDVARLFASKPLH